MSTHDHHESMPTGASGSREFGVLLACFEGASGASKARHRVHELISKDGDVVLDQVVLRVDATHRARVVDPRKVWAGALTSALTWGLFGLVTGGWASLVVWAVLGAAGGGGYAYYTEHVLTKDELTRIGQSIPPGSSALALYLQTSDPDRVLSQVATVNPTTASIAAISADLSTQVRGGSSDSSGAAVKGVRLAMLLVRYDGEKAAHDALRQEIAASAKPAPKGTAARQPQIELLIETDAHGGRRVVDPKTGARATSRSDVVSWGLFGVVVGALAGYLSTTGILVSVQRGAVTGIGYAVFGLVAGALYGLWVGRGVSARRLRRMGPLLPPNSSTVLAWADDSLSSDELTSWAGGSAAHTTLWFAPTATGARLDTER